MKSPESLVIEVTIEPDASVSISRPRDGDTIIQTSNVAMNVLALFICYTFKENR
jgi:hypothetical protein